MSQDQQACLGLCDPVQVKALLSIKEAAQLCHLGYSDIYDCVMTGVIPAQKVGRQWVIRRSDVEHLGALRQREIQQDEQYEQKKQEETRDTDLAEIERQLHVITQGLSGFQDLMLSRVANVPGYLVDLDAMATVAGKQLEDLTKQVADLRADLNDLRERHGLTHTVCLRLACELQICTDNLG